MSIIKKPSEQLHSRIAKISSLILESESKALRASKKFSTYRFDSLFPGANKSENLKKEMMFYEDTKNALEEYRDHLIRERDSFSNKNQ